MTRQAEELKTLVVCNRHSGRFDEDAEYWDTFRKSGARIVEFDRETILIDVIVEALQSGLNTVVAAGGDGTVNAVVNALMSIEHGRRPRMAILPLGTANDFAGTLCLPDNINDAISLIEHSRCVAIDVVRIRSDEFERHYANVAAGGNSVRVTEEITSEMKARWGAFCYLRGALTVLADLEIYQVDAVLDEERIQQLGTWAILVANGKTNAGRILVAPEASPTDGLMDVILIRDGSVMDMIDIVGNAVLGSYLESGQVIHRQVKHFQLDSTPGMRFTVDGEVIDKEPVTFDVVPAAIEMYVGTDFQESRVPTE
jgi:diacylglycerol kinase (ATP)